MMFNITTIITPLEIILLVFALFSAFFIIYNKNILTCIIILSAFSLIMTVIYILLDAPDVAITEASVGACVSTIILLTSLTHININNSSPKNQGFTLRLIFSIVLGIMLVGILSYLTLYFPDYGEHIILSQSPITKHYIQSSGIEIGIPEIVTSILASYRGYDTLGETIVIFTAAICVLTILNNKNNTNAN
ncbi:Mnh complex subunit A1 [Rickettsiales bacterium Ac37b]|nr:Mnh complex subunit A1 [Rickettsiales bacterium Ac37b]